MSLSSVETFILRLPRTNTCEHFLYRFLHVKPVWNEFYQEHCHGNTKIYPGVFGSTRGFHIVRNGDQFVPSMYIVAKKQQSKTSVLFSGWLDIQRGFLLHTCLPHPLTSVSCTGDICQYNQTISSSITSLKQFVKYFFTFRVK